MFKAMKEYLELRFLLFFNPLDSLSLLAMEIPGILSARRLRRDVLARISRAFLLHLALCAYAGCSRRLHRAIVDAVSSEPPLLVASVPAAMLSLCRRLISERERGTRLSSTQFFAMIVPLIKGKSLRLR